MLRDESQIVRFRLGELGELALNAVGYPELDEGRGYVSSVMVPRSLQGTMPVIGALILAIMSMGAVWSEFTVTEVYFVSYLAIIFVWPYYDTRFWLPIIPLVIAYSGRTLKQFYRYPICRALTCGYVTAFAGVGLWWLVASTVITFAGSDFPNVYQEGYYHATYCSFYHSCNKSTPQSFPDVPVSQSALRVLRTYK